MRSMRQQFTWAFLVLCGVAAPLLSCAAGTPEEEKFQPTQPYSAVCQDPIEYEIDFRAIVTAPRGHETPQSLVAAPAER